MSKDARKLWLGDWREDGDTFVITQPDDEDFEPLPEGPPKGRRALAIGAAAVALAALGLLLASDASNRPQLSAQVQIPQAQAPIPQIPQAQIPQTPQGVPPQGGGGGGGGFGGPDLTGAEAEKAAQAALRKYPGDIERVTAGPSGGGYVVHVITPDGDEVHVIVSDQFKVQGSDAGAGPRTFGPSTSQ